MKTLWLPGILLFCAIALPWYFAVQIRNPEFFREFILEHNLGRFSKNLYHHTEPFWYYLPVTALALLPWTVFVIAAFVQVGARVVGSAKGEWTRQEAISENQFSIFAMLLADCAGGVFLDLAIETCRATFFPRFRRARCC